VRHKVDQTKLPIHDKGPTNPDLNWLLVAPKLKRLSCSMWKSIVDAWLNVRSGLIKSNPTTSAEILKQPIFNNLSILSSRHPAQSEWSERRMRLRSIRVLSNQGPLKLRKQIMEGAHRPGNESPPFQHAM
jgi:hypothetical protein